MKGKRKGGPLLSPVSSRFSFVFALSQQGLYDPKTRRQRKRRVKSEFGFFQSLSKLFLSTYFVKCRRTHLEMNSQRPYPSTAAETKFCRCLFTSSIKREIRHFHVVVVQKRAKKCTKERDARAKLLFCLLNLLFCFVFVFFDVLVAVRVVGS